jgi:ribosomal protein L11 methyltransferase
MTVLDVGCGSGILSIAAHLLGAGFVIASDIDPNAIDVARQLSGFALFAGSADAICSGVADLVLANISARVIDALAPNLNRVAKREGLIILAGFVGGQPPRRLQPVEMLGHSEWSCWVCKQDPVLAAELPKTQPHTLQWW